MKKLLVTIALLMATVTAASAETLAGRWAVDGPANCSVPSKSYTANVSDQNIIVWQDGLGNTDFEQIVFSDEREIRSFTINSVHQGKGHLLGTGWIYEWMGPDALRITKTGKTFFAVRCQ